MRGRPPLPSAIHEKRGSYEKNPQRRNEKEPVIGGEPQCPAEIEGIAEREWDRITGLLRKMKVLTEADAPALEFYCKTYAAWCEADANVKKYGQVFVQADAKGNLRAKRNPYDVVRERNAALCIRLLAEFGLTPSTRTRLHIVEGHESNPFEDFLRAREN